MIFDVKELFELGHKMSKISLFLLVCLLYTNAAIAKEFLVFRDHIVCVINNAESYLDTNFSPIILELARCPHQNTRGISVAPKFAIVDGNNVDLVVSLTRRELKCMSNINTKDLPNEKIIKFILPDHFKTC